MKVLLSIFSLIIFVGTSVTAQVDYDFLKRKSNESDVVVIGRVSEKESFWSTDKKMIFTSNKITVLGKIKGETSETIEIITFGGEVDDKFQVWSHERSLNLDDSGYFFLKTDRTLFAKPQEYYLLNGEDGFILLSNYVASSNPENVSVLTDKVVEFGFDNIRILPPNKFSFDLLIKTNNAGAGLHFGYGDVLTKYSNLVFGSYVDSNDKLEIEKETVINSPSYFLATEDFASDIFKALISGGCNSGNSLVNTGIPLTTVFQKLISVTIEVQDFSVIGTISLDDFLMDGNIYYYDPATEDCLPFDEIIYPNPIETASICLITSFGSDLIPMAPNNTAAGTDNILTITGFLFGDTPGTVEFQNADAPGGNLVSTTSWDFTPASGGSWTSGEIKVKVPSSPVPAGSGFFQVKTSNGFICPSPDPLEICYAATTFRTSSNEVRKIFLADYPNNEDGQFSFRLDEGLNNNINSKSAVEMAICDWHAQTGIYWGIGNVYTGTSPAIDNINHIFLAPSGVFSTNPGANMRTILGGERIPTCNDISTIPPIFRSYTTDIDIAIRADLMQMSPPALGGWNFDATINPNPNQLDFYSIIQHELGHAHLLSHALHENKKMFPNSTLGIPMRSIDNKDGLGGNYILDVSDISLNPVCPTAVGRSVICGITATNDFYKIDGIKAFPNPFVDEVFLSFSLESPHPVKIDLFNLLGVGLMSINLGTLSSGEHSINIPIETSLPSGIYFLSVNIAGSSWGYKLVKI